MYYCTDCGGEFVSPQKTYEKHGLTSPPYEVLYTCPFCGSLEFVKKQHTHCRCCGAKLKSNATEYCSDACRNKGEKLWLKQKLRQDSEYENPINKIIRELKSYNKHNGTDYSYGQYVSKIYCKGGKKKCLKKKRNT